jgi:hypothetical protein
MDAKTMVKERKRKYAIDYYHKKKSQYDASFKIIFANIVLDFD